MQQANLNANDAPIAVGWDQALGPIQRQETHFWEVECESRQLTAKMTPVEEDELSNLILTNPQAATPQEIARVTKGFGNHTGCTQTAKRILFNLASHYSVGQTISTLNPAFTLAKHILVGSRVPDQENLQQQEGPELLGCNCLASTYMMPKGCCHTKVKLTNNIWLPTTLCHQCSKCIRCGRLLGCISVMAAILIMGQTWGTTAICDMDQ